jgi:hypothetical protein
MSEEKPVILLEQEKIHEALKVFRTAYDEMTFMKLGPWNIRYALLLTAMIDRQAAKNTNVSDTALDLLIDYVKADFNQESWKKIWATDDDRRSKN